MPLSGNSRALAEDSETSNQVSTSHSDLTEQWRVISVSLVTRETADNAITQQTTGLTRLKNGAKSVRLSEPGDLSEQIGDSPVAGSHLLTVLAKSDPVIMSCT